VKKRFSHRFTKRLELTFSSGDSKFTGISSDLSEGGLFIRTQHGLTPGSLIDIEIYLPNGEVGRLKGIVRRTVKAPLAMVKNGMGVELVERNQSYLEFLKNYGISVEPEAGASPLHDPGAKSPQKADDRQSEKITDSVPESVIIPCRNCKVKNRIPSGKLPFGPKCGKCGTPLSVEDIA